MQPGSSRRAVWLGVFSLAVLAAIGLVAATHPEQTRQFSQSFASLSPATLAIALVVVLGQVSAQALRLWAIIPRDAGVSIGRAGYVFTVGDWTNIFIPARGGDALKVVLLNRSGLAPVMPLTTATGAVLADKVVDIGTLVLLCAVAGLGGTVIPRVRETLPAGWIIAAALTVLGLVGAWVWLSPSPWMAARKTQLRSVLHGQSALTNPVWCSASVSFSIAARATELLALGMLGRALGFPLAPPQLLLALVLVNLSTAVPVSFANLGVYEAGLAYGLTLSEVPLSAAVAIATTHHALQLLGITLSAAGYALVARVPPTSRARIPQRQD